MKTCPVCKTPLSSGCVCPVCDYDMSADFTEHRSLSLPTEADRELLITKRKLATFKQKEAEREAGEEAQQTKSKKAAKKRFAGRAALLLFLLTLGAFVFPIVRDAAVEKEEPTVASVTPAPIPTVEPVTPPPIQNMACTYEENGSGITVTGYEGELPDDLILPGEINGKTVIAIGDNAFWGCDSLTSVTIPDSVTSIGNGAFGNCDSLTSVTIPDSVTIIGGWAFAWCYSLTSVAIPDSVTSIGGHAFAWCYSLTSVTIPDSVTIIGGWAFSSCDSLTSVTIPDSVTSIGDNAFEFCVRLASVTIPADCTVGEEAFPSTCIVIRR